MLLGAAAPRPTGVLANGSPCPPAQGAGSGGVWEGSTLTLLQPDSCKSHSAAGGTARALPGEGPALFQVPGAMEQRVLPTWKMLLSHAGTVQS